MQTVSLQPIFHNKEERTGIYFTYSEALNDIVKKIPNSKWSSTRKCWHMPCTKEAYTQLSNELSGKAILETRFLETYLQQRKNGIAKLPSVNATKVSPSSRTAVAAISKGNEAQLQLFLQHLQLKAYSKSTIKTYTNEFSAFLQVIGKTKAETFTPKRIKDYLQYCHTTLQLRRTPYIAG
jgi:integrase/recombinase XerD